MTTTLTDRYVAAVRRGIPAAQRDDLERELRASIADAIDDRIESGADPDAAERETIAELGDPIELTARYAGRPLHLIGPTHYADWKRLMVVLELTVVPVTLAALIVVGLMKGQGAGAAIGDAVWTSLVVATQLAFWITAMFAVIERLPSTRDHRIAGWTPDMLPETSRSLTSPREFVAESAFLALLATALIVSPFVSPFADAAGAPIPLIDPWMWSNGLIAVLVAVLLAQIGLGALRLRGSWTLPRAVGAMAVDLIGAVAFIVLGTTGHVINPAFADAAGWPELVLTVANISVIGVGVLAIATSVWENLRAIRRV